MGITSVFVSHAAYYSVREDDDFSPLITYLWQKTPLITPPPLPPSLFYILFITINASGREKK